MTSGTISDMAVILAAGRGTRMQRQAGDANNLSGETKQLAAMGLKGLIPVNGRPFLDYTVERLCRIGVSEICFVISSQADLLRDYGENAADKFDINVNFAVQHEPRGTAHAVLSAEKTVGGRSFLLCNCDNLYPEEALDELKNLPADKCGVAGFDQDVLVEQSNFDKKRVAGFAVLNVDADGHLLEIVEKPQSPEKYKYKNRIWVSMNLFRFTPQIFEACRSIEPNKERGELELTDAVSRLIRYDATDFRVIYAKGAVLDMTGKDDIETVVKLLK